MTIGDLEQYDYALPRELIAQQPLTRRTDARLLVVDRATQSLDHLHVRDLPALLDPRDAIVLNDTRVIPARLVGYRTRTGGRWTGLFLSADQQGVWKVLGQTRGKLTAGETVTLHDGSREHEFQLRMLTKLDGGAWAAKPEVGGSAQELLERVGRVPLPPYIRGGQMTPADRQSYQTVFAARPGAVAAPTAGLHFTDTLLSKLADKGIVTCRVTLHVGLGTFRPIAAERIADHPMHAEWGCVEEATVGELLKRRAEGGRIVAIGTTSVRVLETASQHGTLQPWRGDTSLFIRPPYTFKSTDALMTNFHLPKSTLLILVRTFGGDVLMRRAYEVAIAEQYRFYSYGDAMLIV